MADHLRFIPVASMSPSAFAELFTRTFEGYRYPATMTVSQLTTRARIEQLDFSYSVVMLLDDEPAGQALLGLRADRAWCGGFGLVPSVRGRGLGRRLGEALLEQVQAAGATQLSLEVLTSNTPAIQLYRRLGLTITRDLQLFEWTADDAVGGPRRAVAGEPAGVAVPPRDLLQHFAARHAVAAAWQRDLPALLVRPALHGLSYTNDQGRRGYVLYSVRDGTARIEDLGATHVEDAIRILQDLQVRYHKIVSVNEPADSPISAAYIACGFREADRQHEMAIQI